jgi:hypothetical protein
MDISVGFKYDYDFRWRALVIWIYILIRSTASTIYIGENWKSYEFKFSRNKVGICFAFLTYKCKFIVDDVKFFSFDFLSTYLFCGGI